MEKYMYYANKYKIEWLVISFCFMFVVNFFTGKKINRTLVQAFHDRTLDLLNANFSQLGLWTERNTELKGLTYSEYEYYASGRKNAHYMKIQYELKKRQDLISLSFLSFIWPKQDEVWLEIGIDCDLPIEMILVRKENAK